MTPNSLSSAATNRPDTSNANVARAMREAAEQLPTGMTKNPLRTELRALADALDERPAVENVHDLISPSLRISDERILGLLTRIAEQETDIRRLMDYAATMDRRVAELDALPTVTCERGREKVTRADCPVCNNDD